MIFKQYWELHLGLWSCWLLLTIVLLQAENSWIYHARPYWLLSMVIIFPAGGVLLAEREYLGRHAALVTLLFVLLLLVLIGDLRSSRARRRPRRVRFRLVNALMLLAAILGLNAISYLRHARTVSRNFYGTLVLLDEDRQRPDLERYVLVHGPIIHGLQFRAASKRSIPTTYYGPESGIGLSLLHHPVRLVGSRPMRIGVIGLGVGTVAAYGQPGDYIRFYEINPEIIRLAQTQFTFLKDSKAHIDIVPGDARLSLEGELSRNEMQRFDILALDAFSGDTIPVHLLTSEAFRAYITHLAPDGILAVHLSNRAVDLRPVVKTLAQHFSLKAIWIPSRGDGFVTNESSWMVLAQNKKTLDATALHVATVPYSATNGRLWTDNYSNMLEIVRRAEISF